MARLDALNVEVMEDCYQRFKTNGLYNAGFGKVLNTPRKSSRKLSRMSIDFQIFKKK